MNTTLHYTSGLLSLVAVTHVLADEIVPVH
jgi:hypothetical protein